MRQYFSNLCDGPAFELFGSGRLFSLAFVAACGIVFLGTTLPAAAQKKPNILVIWGDDIGVTNLSCYSRGMMGYQTPNIDRLADEGNTIILVTHDPEVAEHARRVIRLRDGQVQDDGPGCSEQEAN